MNTLHWIMLAYVALGLVVTFLSAPETVGATIGGLFVLAFWPILLAIQTAIRYLVKRMVKGSSKEDLSRLLAMMQKVKKS